MFLWIFLADIFAVFKFLETDGVINQFTIDVAHKKTQADGKANITRLTGLQNETDFAFDFRAGNTFVVARRPIHIKKPPGNGLAHFFFI